MKNLKAFYPTIITYPKYVTLTEQIIPFARPIEILVQNVQSVKNKIHILEDLLENHPYQILCLCETWITRDQKPYTNINGYKFAADFNRAEHRGGGVAIVVRQDVEYNELKDFAELSTELIAECCAIELVTENCVIINVYRPDRDIQKFFEFFKRLNDKIKYYCTCKQIILTGDFNLDMLSKSKDYQRVINIMLECNLQQIITSPTRITKTTATCLDLIFTNKTDYKLNISELGISDHKALIYSQESRDTKRATNSRYITKRFFSNKNILSFKQELKCVNWSNILLEKHDANTSYNLFEDHLLKLLNRRIPKKQIKISHKHIRKPYLTKSLKTCCRNKRLLKILTIYFKNDCLKNYYKMYAKILKKCVKTASKMNFIHKMDKSKNKTKTMWAIVNSLTNKNNTDTRTPKNIELKDRDDTIITSPLRVACTFNNYFLSVGKSSLSAEPLGRAVLSPPDNSMFLSPVTEKEIRKIITNMNNKTSFGADELPPILIKACSDELLAPIVDIINKSFKEGCFPDKLKLTKIKPLLKKGGNALDPSSYRPIALLPTISKIYEKAMANRVCSFLEKYKILNTSQYGFRKNRSTILAVYHYVQEIYTHLNDGKYALGVFLDMSKAYDRVSKTILLTKIYGCGIRGPAYEWIKSYLTNRQQYVQIEYYDSATSEYQNITSDIKVINNSIPQGGVLACILFLLYINDLPMILNTTCILFADDVSLLFKYAGADTNLLVEENFNKTKCWLQDHNLEINFKKTKVVQFKTYKKKKLQLNPLLEKLGLSEVDNFCLLGIKIDSHLNWKQHIEHLKTKLSRFIYALSIIKTNTNFKTALSAYYAYAYAWLSYGLVLWGDSTDFADIFVLQKKCLRILVNIKPRESCKPHFIEKEILTLPSMYIYQICQFVKKHRYLFKSNCEIHPAYTRRHKNKLVQPINPKLALTKGSPNYRSVAIYNNLPDHLEKEENYNIFNRKLKSLLAKKAYYSVKEYMEDKEFDV